MGQEVREWEVYTPTGVERRAYSAPTTVEVGLPEPVEVPSEVTGTGQGTRLTDVEVVVSEGMGGRPAAGPVSDQVTALAEDAEGNVWVGTAGGLSRFDGSGWTTFTQADGLAGNWVVSIAVDPRGQVWTVGAGGITHFDGRNWTHYVFTEAGGDVAVAPSGDVWVAGDFEALYRFDGGSWWRYGPQDGLPRQR
ncbi:MAG: two-component regulator propeller domain-containing protein [Candidatus Latescibacterota bacterium]